MPKPVTSKDLTRFFRALAQQRWRNATPEARFQAARKASLARWEAFRAWKAINPEAAAAAAAVGRALRALCPKNEPGDDELVERLEARLERAQEAGDARLPWGTAFRRRARGKS